MIGNDVRCDINGAKEAGLDTFYIHSNISPKDDKKPDSTYYLPAMDMKKVKELMSFGRQPDFFLLVLIRGDFYNRVYTGLDGPPTLELENEKFSYYKVAIPYGVAN